MPHSPSGSILSVLRSQNIYIYIYSYSTIYTVISKHHLLKRFSPMYFWCLFKKKISYFWVLHSVLANVSVFTLVTCCFGYSSFIQHVLKSGIIMSPALLYWILLVTLAGSLQFFHTSVKSVPSCFCEECCCYFDGCCIESIDDVGQYTYVKNMNSSSPGAFRAVVPLPPLCVLMCVSISFTSLL